MPQSVLVALCQLSPELTHDHPSLSTDTDSGSGPALLRRTLPTRRHLSRRLEPKTVPLPAVRGAGSEHRGCPQPRSPSSGVNRSSLVRASEAGLGETPLTLARLPATPRRAHAYSQCRGQRRMRSGGSRVGGFRPPPAPPLPFCSRAAIMVRAGAGASPPRRPGGVPPRPACAIPRVSPCARPGRGGGRRQGGGGGGEGERLRPPQACWAGSGPRVRPLGGRRWRPGGGGDSVWYGRSRRGRFWLFAARGAQRFSSPPACGLHAGPGPGRSSGGPHRGPLA